MERDLENMRECYRQGRTKEATWRKSQLKGLLTLMKEKEQDIFKALQEDLGKHYIEAFRDEVQNGFSPPYSMKAIELFGVLLSTFLAFCSPWSFV